MHADWGLPPSKRWVARARSEDDRWLIEDLYAWDRVAATPLASLRVAPGDGGVLVGADFPIGVPEAFARKARLPRFPEALELFGNGEWAQFLDVASLADEIDLRRPFYPSAPGGKRRFHLEDRLGLPYAQLLRLCERATPTRRAACSLFWTLGANQVGKGAISGWKELVRPLVAQGAALWPFDGDLKPLLGSREFVVAETYPAEYYEPLGLQVGPAWAKRRQKDRADRGVALEKAAADLGADLADPVSAMVRDGFGPNSDGEDPFDALVGLLGMLRAVEDGAQAPDGEGIRTFEGWILGQRLLTPVSAVS